MNPNPKLEEADELHDPLEAAEPREVQLADRFPCPQCGANLTFDPDAQSLHCAYCGYQLEIEGEMSEAREYDLAEAEALASQNWGQDTEVVQCSNCGAQVVLEANQTAQRCSFCGSAHVVRQDQLPGIKPESLIPFQVSTATARQAFSKWIGSHFFAPSDLKSSHQAGTLSGVYIPFWTYDAETYSLYQAQKGTYYWVTQQVTVRRNGRNVTEMRRVRRTRWRHVSGTYAESFDDELVHASTRLDSVLADKVGRYDLSELREYRPEYLSGFVAEKYSIDVQEGWERARQAIREKIRQGIIRQINGDEVRALQFTTSHDQVKFKHVLLPLWISAYTYRGKSYQLLINGQTGEVRGEAPVSAWKVGLTVAAVLAFILALVLLFGN
ncbi:MAG: hypothetical protein ACOX18_05710 [Bacillota bacterium]|jgi:DNA-directed RNA polymerase subunit RPC12/RpoP